MSYAKHYRASQAVVDFRKRNSELLEELRTLEEAECATKWPPPGFGCCAGGNGECEAIFHEDQSPPQGWKTHTRFEDSGVAGDCIHGFQEFFCPLHADEAPPNDSQS